MIEAIHAKRQREISKNCYEKRFRDDLIKIVLKELLKKEKEFPLQTIVDVVEIVDGIIQIRNEKYND